ncbi:cytochrome P450 [Streptomyces sp. NBC_00669]|uniref:cytochrome P450 n=1 Tax=unclassified Streptomyces TaxID=2593676 RepID=UPI002E2EA77B|nr:cytochrome P450 [Streptomyces sp. NBC_00669]
MTTVARQFDTADISSIDFWSQPPAAWDDTFRVLRDERPISWHKAPEGSLLPTPPDDGFWAVVRHADIVAVSSRPDLYISGKGVQFEELPEEILQATQSIVAMDAPRHLKVRSLVTSAFSPARMEQMRGSMGAEAGRIVADFAAAGECDFVAKVSMPMARWTMTYMLGLDPAELDRFTEAITVMLSSRDEAEKRGRDRADIVNEVVGLVSGKAVAMARARREDPQDDVMTDLVQARVDGDGLTDAEISAFFLLLIGAGFDTPRQTISHAGKALSDFPEQRAFLAADFDARSGKAIEELLRWSTPVLTLRRTAARDIELHGRQICEGDKMALFYPSGNRDERVFADPNVLDLARTPNRHISFGGGGPHHCLGNVLARMELRVLLKELLRRTPDFHIGEPVRITSNFVSAITRMPAVAHG